MEENYILAKRIVEEKYDNTNRFYYMFICALFGLFMKYPDDKELVIKSFRDTKIIIEDRSILEIQKDYNLNLINDDELAEQDQNVCTNCGVSDLGFGYYIEDEQVKMLREDPVIVCSSSTTPSELLNIFVHELNHVIKSWNKSHGNKSDGNVSCSYNRCGLLYTIYEYDKEQDVLYEKEFYSILDEVINVFQTTEILKYIGMLDGVVPDSNFQKYLDTLDKDELEKLNGYEVCCRIFKRIWENDLLRNILEKHLIDGDVVEVANDFDDAVGVECFDVIADSFDDLDYLFCLNNNRKAYDECYKSLDKIVKSITSYKIKK